jgi:hypothetical protein
LFGLARLLALATAPSDGLTFLVATVLPDGLPALRLFSLHGAAALSHSRTTLCARRASRRAFRPAAATRLCGSALRHAFTAGSATAALCARRASRRAFRPAASTRLRGPALRHAFTATAGSAAWALLRFAARLAALGGTAAHAPAGTHPAAFTHALRRRQADAREQHCCGQQEPALSRAVHPNLLLVPFGPRFSARAIGLQQRPRFTCPIVCVG